jgi:Disulphide bond corrector protein DsbC
MTGTKHSLRRKLTRPIQLALLLAPAVFGLAAADNPDDAVHWSATVQAAPAITHDSTITIDLYGMVGDGWHVYGPEQHSGGPTPLRIAVETNDIATAAGPLTGAVAQKVHDTHFGFDTQLYTHPFTVHLPVRLNQAVSAGRQLIPVSVRFQACSDRECLLPRTVHLSVPVDVAPAG